MVRSTGSCFGWTTLFVSLSLVGCAMVPSHERQQQPVVPNGSQCTVEFRPAGRGPESKVVDLPENATVQGVLDQTKATRRFSRIKVDLYRPHDKGTWHRMGVQYDITSKKVDPLHDYHVRPGDRVVVTEDTTDMWDDMMKSNLGPLGGAVSRR